MDEMSDMLDELGDPERQVAELLWRCRNDLIQWPVEPGTGPLMTVQRVGVKSHTIPEKIRAKARKHEPRIKIDRRSNGPAIMAFEFAGGHRPPRSDSNHRWSVHHIYDGKFEWPGKDQSVRAVADTAYFTDARGLVSVHPAIDGAVSGFAWLAWKLRLEAFDRFGFDPDRVLHDYRRRHPRIGGRNA